MIAAKGKKRYNLHLNEANTELVRMFLKGTGFTLSGYVDILMNLASNDIRKKGFKEGDNIEIKEFYKILRISEVHSEHSRMAIAELIREDPEAAAKLIEEGKITIRGKG